LDLNKMELLYTSLFTSEVGITYEPTQEERIKAIPYLV